jgi:phosphate transport system substrate-binding protein
MLQFQNKIALNHIYIAVFVCLNIILYSLWLQIIPPATFDQVRNLPPGEFNYGGSTSWSTIPAQMEQIINKNSQNQGQKFKLKSPYNSIGSGEGINELLSNKLDFSLSSRQLTNDEFKKGLKQIPVAIDGIAIVVNRGLEINGLDVEQLQDIYTDKITNWQDINPQINSSIIPLSRNKDKSGTVKFFQETVLKNKKFGDNVELIDSTTDALRKLNNDLPNGIYYATASEVVNHCTVKPLPLRGKSGKLVEPNVKLPNSKSQCPSQATGINTPVFQSGEYPITRKLYVIINTKDQRKQQAGKAYARFLLTNRGQILIEETSFARIK